MCIRDRSPWHETRRTFSENLACPNEHELQTDEIEPRSFSFNAPFGACPECDGIGSRLEVDEDLVVPNPDLSLVEGAIAPWSLGKATSDYWNRLLAGLGEEAGFELVTPWKDLPAKARKAILHGKDYKVTVAYRNRWGRERRYTQGFEGVFGYIKRKHEETESDHAKDRYEQYMRQTPCPACGGARLNPTMLAVHVGGKSIAEVTAMPMTGAQEFMAGLRLDERERHIAEQVLKEINACLLYTSPSPRD